MNEFLEYYKEVANKLNKKLEQFNKKIEEEDNEYIKENIKLFSNLNCDGKLIRGFLINLGYKLVNEKNVDYSNDLSLAFEVFQTAILIHDDIIDNDNLRRGKETVHYSNYKRYKNITNEISAKKVADSIGICIGDLGLFYSNKIISKCYENDKNLGKILNYYNDIVIKTIKGEILDVLLPFNELNNLNKDNLEENILEVYKLKTAYYTIIGPLCLGMLLGGSDNKKIDDITKFGYHIGIAFQLQDDLLGIFSDDEKIGKVVGSDIEEFKQTFLYSFVKNNKKYYDELIKYYGKKVTNESLDKVRKIFIDSGAKEYVEKNIENNYNEAIKILNNINWLSNDNKKILLGFVDYLNNRKK